MQWDDIWLQDWILRGVCVYMNMPARTPNINPSLSISWSRGNPKYTETPQCRSTFGIWDVEKVHAVVAGSTCRSQNVENTPTSEHFWKLTCRKSARRCGAKHFSKSKVLKTHGLWHLLDVQMPFRVAGARDSVPGQKWAYREGFIAISKTLAGVGQLRTICKDAFRVAGAVQETHESHMLGGQGADFLRRVAFWSIRSSGLLRWLCVTGAALRMTWPHFFVAAQYFRQMEWKNRKTQWYEAVSSQLVHSWRKSRRLVSLLMLSIWKIEEVSQNSFVFKPATTTTITLQYYYNYKYNANANLLCCITIHWIHHTTTTTVTKLHYIALHHAWLHYLHLFTLRHTTTTATTTTTTTLHYTTLQLQLHYTRITTTTALHHYIQQLWVGWPLQPLQTLRKKNLTPTTFLSSSGFALPSMHHNNSPLL